MEPSTAVPSMSDHPEIIKANWKDPRKLAAGMDSSKGELGKRRLLKKRKIEEWPHYASVMVDENGKVHLATSPSVKQAKAYILSQAATRLQEYILEVRKQLEEKVTFPKPTPNKAPKVLELPQKASITYQSNNKRQKTHGERSELQDFSDSESESNLEQDHIDGDDLKPLRNSASQKEFALPTTLIPIRADEGQKWKQWFLDGFKTIQQTACRTIAKEWIKTIHPKKQSTHPYNGNMPRSEHRSPERTRPPYWPPHVRHKEPDHIDKADRTALLVHLLMHTPQEEIVPDKAKSEKQYTARDLLLALQKKQDPALASRWCVLKELVSAREQLENYDDGGIDDDTIIQVLDWNEPPEVAAKKKSGASRVIPNADEGNLQQHNENGSQPLGVTNKCGPSKQQQSRPQETVTAKAEDGDISPILRATMASLANPQTDSNTRFIQEHDIIPEPGTDYHFEGPSYDMAVHNTINYSNQIPGSEFQHHQLQPNVQAYTSEEWHHAPTSGHHMVHSYVNMPVTHGMVGLTTDPRFPPATQATPPDMDGALQSPQYANVPGFPYGMNRSVDGRYHSDLLSNAPHMQQQRLPQRQQQHPNYDMDGSFYLN